LYNRPEVAAVPSGLSPTPPIIKQKIRLMTLLCKQIIVAKSKEVKTECCPVRSSKEGYGSKRAVLPMMMRNRKRRVSFCLHAKL
jgi:hypothetical protein